MSADFALVLVLIVAAGAFGYRSHRARIRKRDEARSLAQDLLPEVRAVMTSCDPAGLSGGAPVDAGRYLLARRRLPGILPKEALFAMETFYQCVDAYARAAREMTDAFSPETELSLGDRIRAKDRRDRCLKDVYYTGENALERLQQI